MTDFLDRFLDDYFAECDEHLAVLRRALLTLEASVGRERPDPAVTEELFRTFHSIKGIAAMVEHRETEDLAHEMESYLRAIREGDARLSTAGVEALIEGTRSLEHLIAERRRGAVPSAATAPIDTLRALVSRQPGIVGVASAGEPAAATWECVFTPSPALIARGVSVDVVRARLREAGEIVSAAPLVTPDGAVAFRFLFTGTLDAATVESWNADGIACVPHVADPQAEAARSAESFDGADVRQGAARTGHYVRVELARLDDLMRMIGDLVIARLRLSDVIQRAEPYVPAVHWRAMQEHTTAIERQLRELREGVMRVRLVPVGEIFRRMPFVVRDLARDTRRRVRLDLSGQDTEIDKFLVERMMDPILHLVRNAVTHGVETVDERIAAGKPPEAMIALRASASGDIVTIEVDDDGRGVDAARVIERAREAGLPVPTTLDADALLDLIASPGFSTRVESDRGSGRGFGMAVVKSTVHELGGSIRMTSEPGQGTRFSIDLPLTLTITDALIARVGEQVFAVPQASVREVVEIDAAVIRAIEGGEVTPYRGAAIPLLRLSSLLGVAAARRDRWHAFIVGIGTASVALVADRIIGQREVVVRTISDPLIRVDGVSGATDLGDGRAILILDTAALARRASSWRAQAAAQSREIA